MTATLHVKYETYQAETTSSLFLNSTEEPVRQLREIGHVTVTVTEAKKVTRNGHKHT
jgi:hypothetical protein